MPSQGDGSFADEESGLGRASANSARIALGAVADVHGSTGLDRS